MRRQRPGDAEGDDGVDVEHRLELLVGHPVGDAVPGVAGVVDDDVDRAEGVDRGGDQLVGGAGLGQVAGVDGGFAVDLARGLLGDVGVEVVDQHLGALAGEQLRGGPADPAGRPGDDRRFPIKKSHRSALSLYVVKSAGRLQGTARSWLTGQSSMSSAKRRMGLDECEIV